MERIGLFKEQGYTTIGDPYVPPNRKPFNVSASQGKQMLIGGTKSRCGLQNGYFAERFNRILEGEAYTDVIKIKRKERIEQSKKNIGKTWAPSSNTKLPSGVGNFFGCFTTHVDAFSAVKREREKYRSPGKNFLVSPAKKGTGYGYLRITIGDYQKHAAESYNRVKEIRKREAKEDMQKRKGGAFKLCSHGADYFDGNPYISKKPQPPKREASTPKRDKLKPFQPSSPAKAIGGCKAGTFTPYPEHSKDTFIVPKVGDKDASKKFLGGVFKPSPCPKSTPTNSIVAQHIHKTMNSNNSLS